MGARAGTHEADREQLAARLEARRREIEEALFQRVCDVSDPIDTSDADGVAALRAAICAALDATLEGVRDLTYRRASDPPRPLPAALAAQARHAARSGVRLDTMLRRCAAAQLLLGEFVVTAADELSPSARRGVLGHLSPQLDQLMAGMAEEYHREQAASRELHAAVIDRLLTGAPADTSELDYDLDGWHLGMIVTGDAARTVVRRIQVALGCRSIAVARGAHSAWAWMGRRRPLSPSDIRRMPAASELANVTLAVGEPARGIDGWRLTHHQARAAQWLALRRPGHVTSYGDEPLLAATLRDETLARSLREIYLTPLGERGNGGAVARETLRAYFAASCNAATAAAALGVDRHTVQRRLRRAEDRLGRNLSECRAEVELALRLDQLETADADAADQPASIDAA